MHEQMSADQRSTAHLTIATHRALDFALTPASVPGSDLQAAMRELCAAARRQGMRAEELIVLFKKTWAERPELRTMPREETARLFDSVVSMCVEEFYSDAS
jgi:hypothetical protein